MAHDLDDVCDRLDDIKKEIRESRTHWASAVLGIIFISLLFDWADAAWHSKMRYAIEFSVPQKAVLVEDQPHDCSFLSPPLGKKYCHHERVVSTVRWATSKAGTPIVSYDEEKTWTTFTPDAGIQVPQYSTVQTANIGWEKKED